MTVANILTKPLDIVAAVCDFVTTNITLENVTTSVTSYNPAHCGVYGYYPSLQPLLSLILVFMMEPGNIFLCALALTDIAQILLYAPTAVFNLVHGEIPGEGWCRVQAFLTSFLATFSVYLQASLWICRFIHIAFPLDYSSLMSKRRLAVAMTICFLIALAPPLVGIARVGTLESWTVDVSSVDIAQPLSLMISCTFGGPEGVVYITLLMVGVVTSCVTAGLIFKVAWDNEKRHTKLTGVAKDQFNQKLQAAKTLAIITGVQLVTWCPGIIVGLLGKFGIITTDSKLFLIDLSFVALMTSTFTDSIVYAKRKNIYCRAVDKIFGKIRKYFERKKELESIPMRRLRRKEDI
ncbi:adenosine receptor A2b-like [Branchiostoma floridae x Branchiostoma japonicum]